MIGGNETYRTEAEHRRLDLIALIREHDTHRATSLFHSCIDPHDVPGVLFANRPILGERHSIADVAPTILQLFGLPVPQHMDGKPWTVRMEARPSATGSAPAPVASLGV